MSKTNAELRDRVAEDLGVKGQDIELSDEQAQKLEGRISSTWAHFTEKGLFWWPDGTIPDSVFDGLAKVMCARACASVRKQGQGFESLEMPGLAEIAAVKPPALIETLKTLYY